MAGSAAKGNKSYYIHTLIYLLIIFGFWFIPPFGGITELGMKVLGVFLGVLYGWIFIGFIWPSLFGMMALGITGYASMLEVFQGGFGNSIFVRIFFVFIFAGLLQTTGLTDFIAKWCVSRKICRGRPWVLISMLFVAVAFVGGFINLYAGIIIVWCIFYGIFEFVGLKKGDPLVSYIVVGVALIGGMGSMSLPFLPNSIIWRSMLQEDILTNYTAPMGKLVMAQLLLIVTLIIGYLIAGRFLLRIKTDALKNLSDDYFAKIENIKMTHEQKVAMESLIGFIIILVLPMIAPAGPVRQFFTNVDVLGASVIMIIFFLFRRKPDGEYLYNFGKMVHDGSNWDILILFMATMPISAAMEAEETGIVSTLVSAVMPIFQSISPSLYLIFCLIIFVVVTQFAHNLILGIVFTSLHGASSWPL